ncbi:MAG: hypothetical protein K0A95_09945 [Chromatiales bacterium]|nr:hypothetical protein [Gammaproteobacteria bacterium]MBW6477380.1 hypothetical protein [Chromatiales bacterium]
MRFSALFMLCLALPLAMPAQASDPRQKVEMPEIMRQHMLANMRDHLLALEGITRLLSEQKFQQAADLAEQRLGMSSLNSHGAAHMAQVMPEGMRQAGTAMHQAASQFAVVARDAEVEGGMASAFGALSRVMRQCVACHDGYRVH